MTEQHKRQLFGIGLFVAVGVPLVLAAWVVASSVGGLDLVLTCRLAGVSSMLLLTTAIFMPFFLRQPTEAKLRGYVVVWFLMSVGFNLVWQLPRVIFKSTLVGMELSRANLPMNIAWWGYTLSDSHYHQVSPMMITVELWWLLANGFAVFGLWLLRRGESQKAYIYLGVGGALQAYNASLYVVGNGVMDHFSNIPPHSILAQVLYWGFNPLWTLGATLGSIVSFRLLLSKQG